MLMQCALWGNKADLSLSAGSTPSAAMPGSLAALEELRATRLLVDHTEAVGAVIAGGAGGTVDIVLDNTGEHKTIPNASYLTLIVHTTRRGCPSSCTSPSSPQLSWECRLTSLLTH